ncbi:MAG TPA: hypothetical protein VNA30_07210 [Mycobacteriales bacterium]|nr:hypothetical protein [Mycobacteriales bacterium]
MPLAHALDGVIGAVTVLLPIALFTFFLRQERRAKSKADTLTPPGGTGDVSVAHDREP